MNLIDILQAINDAEFELWKQSQNRPSNPLLKQYEKPDPFEIAVSRFEQSERQRRNFSMRGVVTGSRRRRNYVRKD